MNPTNLKILCTIQTDADCVKEMQYWLRGLMGPIMHSQPREYWFSMEKWPAFDRDLYNIYSDIYSNLRKALKFYGS